MLLGEGLVGCPSLSLFHSPLDRYLGCQDARAKTSEGPSGQWPGCGGCQAGMDIDSLYLHFWVSLRVGAWANWVIYLVFLLVRETLRHASGSWQKEPLETLCLPPATNMWEMRPKLSVFQPRHPPAMATCV